MASEANDKIYTPINIAKKIISEFDLDGTVLDAFYGNGVFYENYPNNVIKHWCEIDLGKNFFDYNEKVDWIVTNPPYSIFGEVLSHSLKIADNIVYLIPINKLTSSFTRVKNIANWGGIPKIIIMSPKEINFPFGFAVGAVYFKKGYKGNTEIKILEETNYDTEKSCN